MIVCFGEVLIDCLPDRNIIGGAPFNVAISLKRMGNDVLFVSKIGADQFGDLINDFAANEKIDHAIQKEYLKKTGYVSVKFNQGEPLYTIHQNVAWQTIDYFPLKSVDYIVYGSLATLNDHNKTTLENHIKTNPIAIRVCDLNLRKPFYNDTHIQYCISNCDLLKVNQDEWMSILNLYKLSEQDFIKRFTASSTTIGIIVTKGEKGADFKSLHTNLTVAPQYIKKEDFKDPIGAGDGFLAAFINQWIRSNNPKKALEDGISHASKICKTQGAVL